MYDERRQIVGELYSSSEMDCTLQRDDYGRTTYASNDAAQTAYLLNAVGGATNEVWTVCDATATMTRTFDTADRLTGLAISGQDYEQFLAYSTNGVLSVISNSDAVVTYAYSDDLRDVGYSIVFANGGAFARTLSRDPFRRDLIQSVTNACGGNTHTLEYSYDALSRPISRNTDTFG